MDAQPKSGHLQVRASAKIISTSSTQAREPDAADITPEFLQEGTPVALRFLDVEAPCLDLDLCCCSRGSNIALSKIQCVAVLGEEQIVDFLIFFLISLMQIR